MVAGERRLDGRINAVGSATDGRENQAAGWLLSRNSSPSLLQMHVWRMSRRKNDRGYAKAHEAAALDY